LRVLTASERSQRASIAAHSLHSQVDSRVHTAPARAASPQSLTHWEARVDPAGELTPNERRRRAEHARVAYMKTLALKSARARRARRAARAIS
jgi:hypothetical protein